MAEPEAGQLVSSLKYVMLGFYPYFLLSRSVQRAKRTGSTAGLGFAFTSTSVFHYFLKPKHFIVISVVMNSV